MPSLRFHAACLVLVLLSAFYIVDAQPLANPYAFWFSDTTSINNSLALQQNVGKAGSKGRVVLRDGHLGFSDGSRLRIVGTTLQWFSAFPDSARAVQLARRLRDLGVNCVRFNSFDVNVWPTVSIFDAAETRTLGAGLSESQMQKFDWLVHQLREHGIYYVFSFQSMWTPKPGDGVIQPDSTGWGARVPLIFNPVIQQIQRNIVRTMLEHRNQYTGIAYKDDPALAFMIAAEDAPLSAYWLYTQDIVRPNTQGQASSGSLHVRFIDSLWQNWLQQRYGRDQHLGSAWSTASRNSANMLTNGDFEDPFSTVWQLFVNTNDGAQAILQFSDADKKEGSSSARIRINTLDRSKVVYSLNLNQKIPVMQRLQTYQFSFWAKTTPQRGSRSMLLYIYNGTPPYNSYGLQTEVRLTSTWQKYDFTFTSTATDSTTAYVGFLMGADSGDVFLDDVHFKEVAVAGLRPGESLQKRNIPLSPMLDASITPARAAANAAFLHEQLSSMFSHMRKLVRDTLRSEVLMCPSTRYVSYYDMTTASDYEVFSNTEWRGGANSMLTELYGGTMTSHAQVRPEGKAFVIAHLAYQFPRPYQSEMMTAIPAYNGLQDWDGVFFSVFSENMLAGANRIDSNNYWVLQNKPNVLSLFPWTSSLIRSAAVAPSVKSITIKHTPESRELPSQHVPNNYSLRISPDSRMPLFRRIAVKLDPTFEESYLPHLEISALSGEVDLAALDAENEQIFWDATKGQMRIQTPTHVALMGRLEGQIVTADVLTAEQTTPGLHAVVAMHSLTGEPLVSSNENMLTISTRSLNEGSVFTADNSDLTRWGRGNIQMEGVAMRITITSPQFDSLTIIPLSESGQPIPGVQPIGVTRRAGNKFTAMVDTKVHTTPWYKLVYGITTSVAEETQREGAVVVSQPVYDGILRMHLPHDAQIRSIVDVQGRTVLSGVAFGTLVDVSSLSPGAYVVVVEQRGSRMSSLPFIIHEK